MIVLAGLNLVSMYHTNCLVHKALRNNTSDEKEDTFNDRFIRYNTTRKTSKLASWTLSVISYTEIVIEMILSRRVSKETRWKWVASLEGFKYM